MHIMLPCISVIMGLLVGCHTYNQYLKQSISINAFSCLMHKNSVELSVSVEWYTMNCLLGKTAAV